MHLNISVIALFPLQFVLIEDEMTIGVAFERRSAWVVETVGAQCMATHRTLCVGSPRGPDNLHGAIIILLVTYFGLSVHEIGCYFRFIN